MSNYLHCCNLTIPGAAIGVAPLPISLMDKAYVHELVSDLTSTVCFYYLNVTFLASLYNIHISFSYPLMLHFKCAQNVLNVPVGCYI